METIEPNIRALAVFAAAWSICCAGAIQLAGMLPLTEAPAGVRSLAGRFLIAVNSALLLVVSALTLFYCVRELRWSSIVVAGGAIFLVSPFLTQDLPAAFKHGKAGLAALLLLLLAAFVLLLTAGAGQLIMSAFTKT